MTGLVLVNPSGWYFGSVLLWYFGTVVLFCCGSVVEKWYDGAGSGKSIRESQNLPVRITLLPSCTQWIWKRVFSPLCFHDGRDDDAEFEKKESLPFQNLETIQLFLLNVK